MTDSIGQIYKVYLIRNPWGWDYKYDQIWNATDPKWTDALVAQMPFDVDPRVWKGPETVMLKNMNFSTHAFIKL